MADSDLNSSDPQRLQEYVDQFEERRSSKPVAREAKKDLRIEMDRRIVYGRPSKAAFRNELSPQQMQRLLEAFQQPLTKEADFPAYQGTVPGIEVKLGDEVLFRQERNSVVTVNQFQQQFEQHNTQQAEGALPKVVEDSRLAQDSDTAILILAKSCSSSGNASIVMTCERAKRARTVERTGVI